MTKVRTHLEEVALWLVKALRLILGLLLTAGSSFAFTAVEETVGEGAGERKERNMLKLLLNEAAQEKKESRRSRLST